MPHHIVGAYLKQSNSKGMGSQQVSHPGKEAHNQQIEVNN
jgi:hypothetical protein